MSNNHSSAETYILGNTSEAIQRLLKQGQLFNPFTRRLLVDAGLQAGMQVLDVGCGPGDVSLIAAELVGEEGSVIGVDTNASMLNIAQARAQEARLSAGLPAPQLRYEAAIGAGPEWGAMRC